MVTRICFSTCAILSFFCALSYGDIYYVDVSATGQNNGSSWTDAWTDLQSALLYGPLESGDEIRVAEGTYKPHASNEYVSFALVDGVILKGGFPTAGQGVWDPAINVTILSGDLDDNDAQEYDGHVGTNSYRIVTCSGVSSSTVLDGFHIRSGYSQATSGEWQGASGLHGTGSPTVRNCWFKWNRARRQCGAVQLSTGAPTFTNCEFQENHGHLGGAIKGSSNTVCQVDRCTFLGNVAGRGGAIEFEGDGSIIIDCDFILNQAGGIPIMGGAYGGGAVLVLADDVTITNCLFDRNTTDYNGGGICFSGGLRLSITNCTFYGNEADTDDWGGGACGGVFMREDTAITNCILWKNEDTGEDVVDAQIYEDEDSTATVTYSCIYDGTPGEGDPPFGGSTNHNIDDDPQFIAEPAPQEEPNYRLQYRFCHSPCINAGNNDAIEGVETDLDGNPRIAYETVDMGPYEAQLVGVCCPELVNPPVCKGDFNGDGEVTPADVGLVKFYYGSTEGEALCRGDVNCDETIDPADVGLVKFYYGTCDAQSPPPCWEEY